MVCRTCQHQFLVVGLGHNASRRHRPCLDFREVWFVSQIRFLRLWRVFALSFASDQMRFVVFRHHCSAGYYGNKAGIRTCADDAALQRTSTKNGNMEIHHLAIQTFVLSSCGTEVLCHTRQTQWQKKQMNIMMFHTVVMMPFLRHCGFLVPLLGRQVTPFKHLVSMEGSKRHSDCRPKTGHNEYTEKDVTKTDT